MIGYHEIFKDTKDTMWEFVRTEEWLELFLAESNIPHDSIMTNFHEIFKDKVWEFVRTEEWREAFLAELDIPYL